MRPGLINARKHFSVKRCFVGIEELKVTDRCRYFRLGESVDETVELLSIRHLFRLRQLKCIGDHPQRA